MRSLNGLRTRYVALFGLGLIAFAAPAAPILPGSPRLNDKIKSLAGLQKLRVSVAKLPGPVADAGLSAGSVRRRAESRLGEAGFNIVEDREAPELRLTIYHAEDPVCADAFAFCVRLAVHQTVRLERLDAPLRLETYNDQAVGMDAEDEMQRVPDQVINQIMERCIANAARP